MSLLISKWTWYTAMNYNVSEIIPVSLANN